MQIAPDLKEKFLEIAKKGLETLKFNKPSGEKTGEEK
jgi:hypothetical protein